MTRFVDEQFTNENIATIGIDFKFKKIKVPIVSNSSFETKEQNVKLQIWDTAGSEKYRTVTKNFFNKADGIMIVYDATNESSFLMVESWVKQID